MGGGEVGKEGVAKGGGEVGIGDGFPTLRVHVGALLGVFATFVGVAAGDL
jgi:hypothetical protein